MFSTRKVVSDKNQSKIIHASASHENWRSIDCRDSTSPLMRRSQRTMHFESWAKKKLDEGNEKTRWRGFINMRVFPWALKNSLQETTAGEFRVHFYCFCRGRWKVRPWKGEEKKREVEYFRSECFSQSSKLFSIKIPWSTNWKAFDQLNFIRDLAISSKKLRNHQTSLGEISWSIQFVLSPPIPSNHENWVWSKNFSFM